MFAFLNSSQGHEILGIVAFVVLVGVVLFLKARADESRLVLDIAKDTGRTPAEVERDLGRMTEKK